MQQYFAILHLFPAYFKFLCLAVNYWMVWLSMKSIQLNYATNPWLGTQDSHIVMSLFKVLTVEADIY